MSHSCQPFLTRMARRRRNSRLRRLWLEALEPRACPAVMFEFVQGDEGGILSVIGDNRPNVIEIFQPRDRVVEVTGGGETRTFSEVDAVFVDSQGGDDAVFFRKPKEIVVVGSKVTINAGAGNDLVHVDDGGATLEPVTWDTPIDVDVELGTGADVLRADVQHHNELHLKLLSLDGGDGVAIGHRLGLRHEHTRPESAAQIDLDLAGGGNIVDVELEDIGNVDLSIVFEPALGEEAGNSSRVSHRYLIIAHGTTLSRDGGVVILYSSLPGGSASGVSTAQLNLVGTISDNSPSSASVALELGSDDDTVSVLTRNIDGLKMEMETGEGNDSVNIDSRAGVGILKSMDGGRTFSRELGRLSYALNLGSGNDLATINSSGYDELTGVVDAGAGDDTVHATVLPSVTDLVIDPFNSSAIAIYSGAGNDNLFVQTLGVDDLQLGFTTGAGDDVVKVGADTGRITGIAVDPSHGSTIYNQSVDLGDGDDHLVIDAAGYGNVNSFLDAGAGHDSAMNRLYVGNLSYDAQHTQLNAVTLLGSGDDRLVLESSGYGDVDTLVDGGQGDDNVEVDADAIPATPAVLLNAYSSASMVVDLGDGANQLLAETTAYADVTQDFRGGEGNDQIAISDRRGPYFQFESKRLNQRVYTGGGNDIVLDDTEGSDDVQAAIDMGTGDDLVFVITKNSTRQGSIAVDLSLGAGSDVALLDILGYSQIAATIVTGPAGNGRDVVGAIFRLTADDRLRRIRRVADGGLDLFELFVGAGYDMQKTAGDQSLIVIFTRSGGIGSYPVDS